MDNNKNTETEGPFTYEVNGVTYIDEERMKLHFSTLIINVESINRHFGTMSSYINENPCFGKTNGKLMLMYEMNDPPHYLAQFAEVKLCPRGLRENEDFVFADERWVQDSPADPDPIFDKPHPRCGAAQWLDSLITRKGNYVWYRKYKSNGSSK